MKKDNTVETTKTVKCRVCRKKTTPMQTKGEGGGDICLKCWRAAGWIETDHNDGYHKNAPVAGCPYCEGSAR